MSAPVTFTLDLEDHRPDEHAPIRFPDATRRMLDFLAERSIVGTFFVVGVVAEAHPDLVREIAGAGHELALHSWQHVPLVDQDPVGFRADVAKGKRTVEDIAGTEVVGYRAPTFSLVPSTTWATDVLHDEGFTYSSSVLPTANPLYGFPGAPDDPFLWPCGLAEFPVPVAGFGRWRVPYLGGTYLRLLPGPLTRGVNRRGHRRAPWTYLHPYDIDRDEPRWRVPDAGRLSPLLWVGRKGVLRKLERLFDAEHSAPPLRDRISVARLGGTYDSGTSDREM